jgi:hypothetical protein
LPYEEKLLTVSLVSNTLGIINQLQALSKTNDALHFRLKGNVSHGAYNLATSLYNLPFEKEGTLKLSTLLNK